jgi:hypothetical protein
MLGLAIKVEAIQSSGRALLLEFTHHSSRHNTMPQHQRFRVPDRKLIECIESAMDSGWDPDSRGTVFVFEAGVVTPG